MILLIHFVVLGVKFAEFIAAPFDSCAKQSKHFWRQCDLLIDEKAAQLIPKIQHLPIYATYELVIHVAKSLEKFDQKSSCTIQS